MQKPSCPGVPVSSVCRVALHPCGQVASLGVLLLLLVLRRLLLLLLALRVAPSTVVRRPAGVTRRRVAQRSSAGVHQPPVVASNVAVH